MSETRYIDKTIPFETWIKSLNVEKLSKLKHKIKKELNRKKYIEKQKAKSLKMKRGSNENR
uniref:Uncharacterized protein n=1 Tax=viral metagenome TaxID=1070528 RepID=A0A6M3LRD2_9ZZZZ